jgi:hypothetical protein
LVFISVCMNRLGGGGSAERRDSGKNTTAGCGGLVEA